MPSARSAMRPILIGLALGAIAIVTPARSSTPPDTTMRHVLYSVAPRTARDFARERLALDARARVELRALSDRIRGLPAGPGRDAALHELSDANRGHRIARLRLDLEAARVKDDRAAVDRIAAILARFERARAPRPQSAGAARDPARERADR
jgi:hypothetical protein